MNKAPEITPELLDLIISEADFVDSVIYADSSGASYDETVVEKEANKRLYFEDKRYIDHDSMRGNLRVVVGLTPEETYVSINCEGNDVCKNEEELEQLVNKELFGENYEQRNTTD